MEIVLTNVKESESRAATDKLRDGASQLIGSALQEHQIGQVAKRGWEGTTNPVAIKSKILKRSDTKNRVGKCSCDLVLAHNQALQTGQTTQRRREASRQRVRRQVHDTQTGQETEFLGNSSPQVGLGCVCA